MWISRDQTNKITGCHRIKQEFTSEELPDNHPDVIWFQNFDNHIPPIVKIDQELASLNLIVSDGLEELLISWETDGKFEPRKRPVVVDETIKRKAELRKQRKELTG